MEIWGQGCQSSTSGQFRLRHILRAGLWKKRTKFLETAINSKQLRLIVDCTIDCSGTVSSQMSRTQFHSVLEESRFSPLVTLSNMFHTSKPTFRKKVPCEVAVLVPLFFAGEGNRSLWMTVWSPVLSSNNLDQYPTQVSTVETVFENRTEGFYFCTLQPLFSRNNIILQRILLEDRKIANEALTKVNWAEHKSWWGIIWQKLMRHNETKERLDGQTMWVTRRGVAQHLKWCQVINKLLMNIK